MRFRLERLTLHRLRVFVLKKSVLVAVNQNARS